MPLVQIDESPVVLRLNRDLVRDLKRGHPWVYADSLRDLPRATAGTPAVLLDNRKGQPVATGFYDPASPIAFRVCDTDGKIKNDDRWVDRRLNAALSLRHTLFDQTTTGYRLLNGEGDSLPGLVVDVYDRTAVMKLDGAGPNGFWNAQAIAEWFESPLRLECVYERPKERNQTGHVLTGRLPEQPIHFLEHGLKFTSDVVSGQKTGFFLDQRENRKFVRQLAQGRTVLNMFSYTGGFSIAAGSGGAKHVTSVDFSQQALDAAIEHWRMNTLPIDRHDAVEGDGFQFLSDARHQSRRWDVVILDPPSFAPNQQSVKVACAAYQSLIEKGSRVTSRGGFLAAASCSSHIDLPTFLTLCEEGISDARRRATVLNILGQPADHPAPLALPEFRYLKFVLIRLE